MRSSVTIGASEESVMFQIQFLDKTGGLAPVWTDYVGEARAGLKKTAFQILKKIKVCKLYRSHQRPASQSLGKNRNYCH